VIVWFGYKLTRVNAVEHVRTALNGVGYSQELGVSVLFADTFRCRMFSRVVGHCDNRVQYCKKLRLSCARCADGLAAVEALGILDRKSQLLTGYVN
jgi:hypothetical protein